MASWIVSNLVVVVLIGPALATAVLVARRRLWREALAELCRRRPIALSVIGIYVVIALLDSVSWVGGETQGADAVAVHEARSVIDRFFRGHPRKNLLSAVCRGRLL